MEVVMRALSFALVLSLAAVTAGAQPAGVVLINGRVYTMDANRPWAEGLAIAGERMPVGDGSQDFVAQPLRPEQLLLLLA
jgi:hypothetical protein